MTLLLYSSGTALGQQQSTEESTVLDNRYFIENGVHWYTLI